jgi:hypothetical protein
MGTEVAITGFDHGRTEAETGHIRAARRRQ